MTKIFDKSRIKASVSITTVIVVTAILLMSGIVVVLNSVDLAKASKGKLMTSMSEIQSLTCLEEVLQRLKINRNFTGTFSITLPDGSCSVIVSNHPTQANYRNVLINSNVEEYYYTETRIINVAVTPILIVD